MSKQPLFLEVAPDPVAICVTSPNLASFAALERSNPSPAPAHLVAIKIGAWQAE